MKHHLQKEIIFLVFFLWIIIIKNIDVNFLTNNLFFSKIKKYHYFSKFLKYKPFNIGYSKKIFLINEIIYLHDIRKEIYYYRDYNYTNIKFKQFSQVVHPKITIILTVYNQGNYLLRMYLCILNQFFQDIEIIIINDDSNDNSEALIKNLMKFDKRIIYIKNKVNKGQFYSRNRAALISRGKYLMIIDPDDFLLRNIMMKSYEIANKFNLDLLQFYHIMGNFSENHLVICNPNSKIIYGQDAKNVFFNYPTRYLWDKLIKKNIFIKSIYFMNVNYRKERFLIHNDETACFGIFKMINSYGQIEDIGYFYNTNISNSTTKKNFLPESINGRFHCMFTIMKYYYEQSDNNAFEKINGGYGFFTFRIIRKYQDKIQFLTKGFKFIESVIDIYLNCSFLNSTQKNLLREFNSKIQTQNQIVLRKNKYSLI